MSRGLSLLFSTPYFHSSLYIFHRSISSKMATAVTKPPNILILTNKEVKFDTYKSDIQTCVGINRYTVYPLTQTDILQQPWKENCSLLIIPPAITLTNDALDIVTSYLNSGGKCLAINSQLYDYEYDCKDEKHSIGENDLVQVLPSFDDNNKQPFYTTSLYSNNNNETQDISDTFLTTHTNGSVQDSNDITKSFNKLTINDTTNSHTTITPPHIDSMTIRRDTLQLDYTEVTYSTLASMIIKDESPLTCVSEISWLDTGAMLVVTSLHLFDSLSTAKELTHVLKIKETGRERQSFLGTLFQRLGLIEKEDIQLGMEYTSTELSYVYLLTQNNTLKDKLLSVLKSREGDQEEKEEGFVIKGAETSALFITDNYHSVGTPVDKPTKSTDKQVTIITKPSSYQLKDTSDFNSELYFKNLKTTSLGKSLLLGPVMSSSQTLFTGNTRLTKLLSNELGVVCSPGQQTKGKGRGGNEWLSPKGCMMFSCPLHFPEGSRLSKRASIIQHIATLSVVSAIRTLLGYEDIPINVKWPNDIYYNKTVKLGGCLVNAYTMDNITTVIIGLGVNVSNHYPTLSINDVLAIYNNQNNTNLPLLYQETLLALSLNKLEMYLSLFNQWGLPAIEEMYYQYWMHHNATVELSGNYSQGRGEQLQQQSAVIIGINEYGYLRVRTSSNEFLSLGPDGNTFDIMKGLICMK